MQSVSNSNFGTLVAYLVPGATVLLGGSLFSPTLQALLATTPAEAPTIGGFLHVTLASLAVGMTVSAVRWLVIDWFHGQTGLMAPSLDFSNLGKHVEAYTLLIEIHYRHYQFYANMLVATAVAYACYRFKLGTFSVGWLDFGFVTLEVIFFVTSRDTLRKYYIRSKQLLSADRTLAKE
jgi:hypothetical protein